MISRDLIPQEKLAAVTRGLREAFGVTEFEDISKVTGGHTSSLVFRIVVRGAPFLLKLIMRGKDSTTADHFTCIKGAADAGLAPRVWYTSIEDQLCITDFVEAARVPLAEALIRLPRTLRALHALPPFPTREPDFNTTCTFLLNKRLPVDAFIRTFQAAGIVPVGECDELLARNAQVAAAYRCWGADMVSSHNDLFKPDNILFSGQRVWLVDWEAAFLNDRYADLAVVANLVVTNDSEEEIYLQEYFGQSPNEYQRARFFLMQQVTHMFYAAVFLQMGSAGEPVDLTDFPRRFWNGEVDLTDKRMKGIYGRFHWNRLLENMRQTRFDEALRIVADEHAHA